MKIAVVNLSHHYREILDQAESFEFNFGFFNDIKSVTNDYSHIIINYADYKEISEDIEFFDYVYILDQKGNIQQHLLNNPPQQQRFLITKPFSINFLLKKILKDYIDNSFHQIINIGNITLDVKQKTLEINNKKFHITDKEVNIIRIIHKFNGKYLKSNILKELWGYIDSENTHTLETHIYNLNKKIGVKLISISNYYCVFSNLEI